MGHHRKAIAHNAVLRANSMERSKNGTANNGCYRETASQVEAEEDLLMRILGLKNDAGK